MQQVQEIMQLEAQRAEAHPGFIPGLIRDYGSVSIALPKFGTYMAYAAVYTIPPMR